MICDPPRSGLHKEIVYSCRKCSAITELIYVSCNPKTLKRDIELLINYNLTKIEGINMFNKTKHVETVCVLERK